MTIIAAYEDTDSYWIGSDSLGASASLGADFGTKLIKKNDYIVGFSASYRVADVIKESRNLPKHIKSMNDFRKFRDLFTENLVAEAGARTEAYNGNGLREAPIGIILISSSGIYAMEADYQIHKIKSGYYANGSGWSISYGALYVAKQNDTPGEQAIKQAVKAAITHSTTCGYKCHIKSILKE